MILGIGTDIAKISRFEENAEKLISRCLTKEEIAEMSARNEDKVSAIAKRFAAKEAFVKALGTGFSDGVSFLDISILHDEKGKPYAKIEGKTLAELEECLQNEKANFFVSIADDGEYAQAFVIIEKYGCQK